MNRFSMLLLAAAGAPLFAFAQPVQVRADVADAMTPVAPPAYRSAFADFRPVQDAAVTPDKLWRQANRTVGGNTEHDVDQPKAPDSAAPAVAPAADVKADPHHGHHIPTKGQ